MEFNKFEIRSPAFKDGGEMPAPYTADGKNISPPLEWNQIPDVKEYALICEDPDAPQDKPFVHWVVYGISPGEHGLREGLPARDILDVGIVQGKNSTGRLGYFGPKPPPETGEHRYYFRLFALDEELNLPPGLTKDELLDAIENHILGEAETVARYKYH